MCTPVFKEMTPLQAAATLDFWLLCWVFFAAVGSGLALLNNLGQLVRALGGEATECVMLVSLFSVANAAGRLAMGWLPEHFLQVRPLQHFLLELECSGGSIAVLGTMCWASGRCAGCRAQGLPCLVLSNRWLCAACPAWQLRTYLVCMGAVQLQPLHQPSQHLHCW